MAKLKAQQEGLIDSYRESVMLLLSEAVKLEKQQVRLETKLRRHNTRLAIARAQYLQGGSSHSQMAGFYEKQEELEEQIEVMAAQRESIVEELISLCGIEQ
jgi:PBP1b-binding outer membrane lipoprotein LpoB